MEHVLRKDNKGTIDLGGKVMVSDPQYGLNCECQGVLDNVLSGKYNCFVEFVDGGEDWGVRVSAIEVIHADHVNNANKFAKKPEDFIVSVDGGSAGIFDYNYFARYHNEHNSDNRVNEAWEDRCYGKTFKRVNNPKERYITTSDGNTIDGLGLVSRSGYGDGGYECYTRRNYEGEIISIRVEFIKTNDIEYEEPKVTKAVEVAVEFWCNEVRKHSENATDEQMSIFARELRNNLGKPCKICRQTLEGGVIGYAFEDCQIVPNAIKSAGINFWSGDRISVQITPWYNNPQKRTIRVYRNSDNGTELATVEEE